MAKEFERRFEPKVTSKEEERFNKFYSKATDQLKSNDKEITKLKSNFN